MRLDECLGLLKTVLVDLVRARSNTAGTEELISGVDAVTVYQVVMFLYTCFEWTLFLTVLSCNVPNSPSRMSLSAGSDCREG
jgi:hypothetical protein